MKNYFVVRRVALAVGCLGLGIALSQGANMTPLTLAGFNSDVVIESTASGPPYSGYAIQVNPVEIWAFYQNGLPGKSLGLPVSGNFVSAVGDGTVFQFQSYTANNALLLNSGAGVSGTLTLSAPTTYARIAVLAHSAGGGGTANLTLNFADGNSWTTTYNAPDWFGNSGFALQGMERISLNDGSTGGAPNDPRFYQTSIDLAAQLGVSNRPLASVTFNQVSGVGCTAVYAISGEVAPQTAATITLNPTNTSVIEATTATFVAGAGGNPFPKLQWLRNGVPIAGATNLTQTLASVTLADNSTVFRLVASNVANSVSSVVTSSPATLTVIPDTNRPVLLGAFSQGLTQVLVNFSERLKPSTATNLGNFGLAGPAGAVGILAATLDAGQSNVLLGVATMANGSNYTLTINGVADQSAAANVILPNSQATFIASVYTPVAIGAATTGSQIPAGNGLNLTGSGTSLRGTNDQLQFSYVFRTNDFDVQVRIDSLSLADAWSVAGLLARESLAAGARSAAALATPSISGCFFEARGTTNGAQSIAGSFPVNYPNTWLRLKRVGNDFTGFAGFDGQNWTQLGTANLTLPAAIYLGFAVSSQNANQSATAAFRDFANVSSAGINASLAAEPLGQSSRLTSLVISEIMYRPTNSLLQFVEIVNTRGEPQDLSGYQLAGNLQYTFPNGTILPGGGVAVVASSPTEVQAVYGVSGVFGPFTGSLVSSSGTVKLINQAQGVFLRVDYADAPPWPVAAGGAGHSLVLQRPSRGENDALAWGASDVIGGSPGRLDPISPDSLRNVVINEFLAHTDPPLEDFVELYNHSNQAQDLSGCWLSDNPTVLKYRIPDGTSLPPRGFVSFVATTLGFNLDKLGEKIFLVNSNRTRVLDAVSYEGQENSVSMGRVPDGSPDFYPLATRTPGTNNGPARLPDVVLNELMYDPISSLDDDQYVELYNRSTNTVNLTGWQFTSGIGFTFPTNTLLAPGNYLVVAKNAARLRTNYANLNPTNCLGNFSGKLSHGGERVALAFPHYSFVTNGAQVVIETMHIVASEVTYGTGGRWGQWSAGGGSSLELLEPDADARLAASWADSDETQKAAWTLLSATGTVDNGSTAADQLQALLQGAGECLLDNVQVLTPTGSNLIANSTFETDASGWTAEGTESLSSLETSEGFGSSRSYHLRALENGDNQVNRIRTPLTSNLSSGTTNVTIRANVRWLKGNSQLLLRLRGNWLECASDLALPLNLGTPGARNSRFVSNAPPSIIAVQHTPTLPAANQAFVITARAQDPDGLASLQLKYRLDPSASYATVVMNDAGVSGDAVAGDGVFSATIPGQASGTLIAFYVQATDSLAAISRFPADAPVRECLVRVGELQPTGNFPVYRIWMTQATLNSWNSRSKLDNSPLDITFVLGNQRAVYNAQGRYKGSPYISPGYCGATCGRCGYALNFPPDDAFLGSTELQIDWPGGHGFETAAMQEQLGYWIADRLNLAFSHRYTIRLHVNGVTDESRQAVFESVLKPGGDYLNAWQAADSGGDMFKIERAFEFNDGGGLISDTQPRLQNFTTTGGVKKREKYRFNFLGRAGTGWNNFTNLYALVDGVNSISPEPYTSATLGLVDVEQWMRIFATEHIIANFDAYGHEIGKNMYAYKPTSGKWQLYMFDLDWLMLAAAQTGRTASSANLFVSEDPTIASMYAFPPFARAYWRAVQDAINGPFDPATYNAIMDAKYASLQANGVAWCDGSALTDPTSVRNWFSQRRAFLQAQLATVSSPFSANSSITISNGVGIVTGTAPVGAQNLAINGVPWNVRWTSVSNWTAIVPLNGGLNNFSVVGLASNGQPVAGASNSVSVTYGGPVLSPVNGVVINEIMFNPALPDAEYVELFNVATNYTYDLSGWKFNGLSYTFPGGSFIAPRSYLVLARDRSAFSTAYGSSLTVLDSFAGTLQNDGETLSLVKPGLTPASDLLVNRVRYEPNAPWPAAAAGVSVQLRDALQDNSRVANWAVGGVSIVPAQAVSLLDYTNAWKFMQVSNLDGVSWSASAFNDAAWPSGSGLLAAEDNALIVPLIRTTLNAPGLATNNAASGHAYYFRTKVVITNDLTGFTINASAYVDDGAVFYVNGVEAARVRMVAGVVTNLSFSTGQPPSGDATTPDLFTLSPSLFTPGTNVIAVEVHQNVAGSSDITFGLQLVANLAGSSNGVAVATPGTQNSVVTNLPAFPALWLNELQADNSTGPIDNFSQHDPWVEIFNAGTNVLNLGGFYLSDTYTNLSKWAFPTNATVAPGQFLIVWCDNQTNQTAANILHTSFRPISGAGGLALSRTGSNAVQIVDYLNYTSLPANWSYGDLPDGQPFFRNRMFATTPGSTNSSASAPIEIYFNEWMADNKHTLVNPYNGALDDWFELYNPGTNAVDLGGYYLTGNLTNKTKFLVPNNGHYVVPAQGYLVVWADNNSAQNSTNRPELHLNFALGKSGDALGLFAADGTAIDALSFGAQTSDVSEGRFPDGVANRFFMPTPTPGSANVVPNTAPVLAAISAKEITVGQTLIFTNYASDADFPAQTLTFSLAAGAAPSATINPNSGVFNWKPTTAPSTNAFSVIVADSGLPSLTATQSFSVVVYLPPTINVQLGGGQMQLTWPRGTLQQADEVTGPFVDVTQNSPVIVTPTGARKFFRIRL